MSKSVVREIFTWVLAVCIVGTFMARNANASEFWDNAMSEEAIIFVENVWVFSGDYSYGTFTNDVERFSRSLDELWGLYNAIPPADRNLSDVTEAVDRLYAIMGDHAYAHGRNPNGTTASQSLIDSYIGIANRATLGCRASVAMDSDSPDCSADAYFLTGLFCVTAVAIVLLCVGYERPCEDSAG